AAHAISPKEAVARARCVFAESEIGCSGEVLPGGARHQLSTLNKSRTALLRTALLMERAHGGERGLRLRPPPCAWRPDASRPHGILPARITAAARILPRRAFRARPLPGFGPRPRAAGRAANVQPSQRLTVKGYNNAITECSYLQTLNKA